MFVSKSFVVVRNFVGRSVIFGSASVLNLFSAPLPEWACDPAPSRFWVDTPCGSFALAPLTRRQRLGALLELPYTYFVGPDKAGIPLSQDEFGWWYLLVKAWIPAVREVFHSFFARG